MNSYHVVKSDSTPTPHGPSDSAVIDAAAPPQSSPPKAKSRRKNANRPPALPESFKSARLQKLHEQRQVLALAEGGSLEAMKGLDSSIPPIILPAASSKGAAKKKGRISSCVSLCVVNLTFRSSQLSSKHR